MYQTDLAFYALRRWDKHQLTESYTEHMKRTQATSHNSKGLSSDKRENTQL